MKIIEPKAEIIEQKLEQLSIYQRTAYCAGVCYQREPRKTEEEAQAFCKRMVETGHHSTLEMAVLHLVVENPTYDDFHNFQPKYLFVTSIRESLIVSGSIRGFKEVLDGDHEWYGDLLEGACNFLSKTLPTIFEQTSIPTYYSTCNVRFAEPHEIPWQHKHVAVRFIVNRAVSHELVRHRPCSFLQESQRYCRYEDEVTFIRPEWWDQAKAEHIGTTEWDWQGHVNTCEVRYKEFLQRGLKPQQARAVLPNSTKTELIAYASLPQWRHMFNLRCSPAADPEMRRIMIPLREEFQAKYPEMWGDK